MCASPSLHAPLAAGKASWMKTTGSDKEKTIRKNRSLQLSGKRNGPGFPWARASSAIQEFSPMKSGHSGFDEARRNPFGALRSESSNGLWRVRAIWGDIIASIASPLAQRSVGGPHSRFFLLWTCICDNFLSIRIILWPHCTGWFALRSIVYPVS
jgi:hypothetical protein